MFHFIYYQRRNYVGKEVRLSDGIFGIHHSIRSIALKFFIEKLHQHSHCTLVIKLLLLTSSKYRRHPDYICNMSRITAATSLLATILQPSIHYHIFHKLCIIHCLPTKKVRTLTTKIWYPRHANHFGHNFCYGATFLHVGTTKVATDASTAQVPSKYGCFWNIYHNQNTITIGK